jgi:hypothetical protein
MGAIDATTYLLGVEVFVLAQKTVLAHAFVGLVTDHFERLAHFLQREERMSTSVTDNLD